MPDLKLLRDELEQTLDAYQAIRDKHKGALLPEEQRVEAERLHERAMKLQILVEEEKTKTYDKDFGDLSKYMSDPQYRVQHSINSDDDGRKSLEQAGWIFKNGIVSRATSRGEVVMYQEGTLFGPMPERPEEQEFFRQTRGSIQPDYRDAYIKFMKTIARTGDRSTALSMMSAPEQKALSEGLDSAGGFLVPPDIQAEIFARVAQQAVMRGLCRTVNTSRDRVLWPRVVEASSTQSGNPGSNGGSIFSSAFVGSWFGESATQTDIDPKFGTMEINVRKIRCSTKMSNDFIADAITDIPAFLAIDGGRNMALVEDQGLLFGQTLGTPALEPFGLMQDAGVTQLSVEGSTADSVTNTTSNAGSAPKLITLSYALPAQYAGQASWLMRRTVEGSIRQLVDGSGRYLWPPMIASGFAQVTREILGNPVYNSDFMQPDGQDTQPVLAFGDFSQYIIVQRAQITSTVLRERFADTDQTGIILWERLGGALANPDSFRFGIC